MSIASEITRISNQRDTLRTNLIGLGLVTEPTAKLEDCVTAVGNIENRGAATATIGGMTGESYTVPAGLHSGTGKVTLSNSIETALAAI